MAGLHQSCRSCGTADALHAPDAEYGVCVTCEIDDIRYALRHPGARIWADLREDEQEETRELMQERLGELMDLRTADRRGNPRREDTIHFAGYDIDLVPTGPRGARESRIRRDVIDTSAPGDYGADPIGDGMFRMVPSGDVVDHAERNRRLGQPPPRGNPSIPIPKRAGETLRIGGHDRVLIVRKTRNRSWVLGIEGEGRRRFADTVAEVRSDIQAFLETGTLPRSPGGFA